MGHGRLLAVLLVLVLATLSGCGSDESARWKTFPIAVYMDPALAANPDADADFRTAIVFWESKVGKQLFEYRGTWTGGAPYAGNPVSPSAIFANVVLILNPWAFPANTVGQTVVNTDDNKKIEASIIMINPGARYCAGDCLSGGSGPSQRKLFAHELGHFLGLGHTGSTADIMFPDLQPGASLAGVSVDIDALHEATKGGD